VLNQGGPVVSSRAVTTQQTILTVVLALGGYLLGATPFALLVARLNGVDIRRVGTRNMGAGNTFYQVSRKAGAVVMACDMAKGFIPAFAAVLLLPTWPTALVAFMPTLGHQYSIFLRGAGGKGIATAAGAELPLSPPVFVITMVLWVVALRIKRVAKLAPLVAGATYLASSVLLRVPPAYSVLAVTVCVSVLWAHRRELRLLRARDA
jgi:glycerol-3-phosphate acyltransferase PlsY